MNLTSQPLEIHNLPRLKWACRRGMLELDVILGKFLNEAYSQLTDEDKYKFVLLLEQADPELFNWLLGHEKPWPEHAYIVDLIRRHAHAKN